MTSDNATATMQVVCPHCGADSDPYPPSCDACGGDITDRVPPRVVPQHAIPDRVSSLWSATEEAECAGDVAAALAAGRRAMSRLGGTVDGRSGNTFSGKVPYRSGYNLWIAVRYRITVSAVPAGARRTSVRVNATLDAGGSFASILSIVVVLVATVLTAGLYVALVALVSIPAQKQLAAKVARLFLPVALGGSDPAPPTPPTPPSPSTPPAGPGPGGSRDPLADIGRLAELRDMGAMSNADFGARKAGLLGLV